MPDDKIVVGLMRHIWFSQSNKNKSSDASKGLQRRPVEAAKAKQLTRRAHTDLMGASDPNVEQVWVLEELTRQNMDFNRFHESVNSNHQAVNLIQNLILFFPERMRFMNSRHHSEHLF